MKIVAILLCMAAFWICMWREENKQFLSVVNIVAAETDVTLRHVVPASLKWVWRKYVSNEIETIPIQVTAGKVTKIAYLNIHGNCSQNKEEKNQQPVLFSHGDYAHPYSMLHLIDMAQNEGFPTYSLYIPEVQNTAEFDLHHCIVKEAVDKIESIVNDNHGKFSGLLGVGHSKGAILLAQRQFVGLDARIKATCSIAGRLNAPTDNDCSDQILRDKIRMIYASILNNSEKPILQIIPQEDWCASYESMAVRPEKQCYTVPGKHLSGLYSSETRTHFMAFLKSK